MIVRNKSGSFEIDNGIGLLDFLRSEFKGGSEQGGGESSIQRSITGDIELICSVPFHLSADEDDKRSSVSWTFSTFDLDRFAERIDPAGWDYKRYMDNPVIEWAHRYDIPAIGKADRLYTDEKGLHGLVIFNDKDYDPFGWAIGQRVKAGVIRAGSVGFRILEIEIPAKEEGADGTALIFRKQELLEFSICNVPANPFALMKSEELGMRSTGTNPSFWGNIINNFEGA
jgi:HK97 family phage prohead protease